jgi:hypothetical protein
MGKRNQQDYDLFYMELPQTDYFQDIEIQDEYEEPNDTLPGLSAEQVSEIARDSLESARQQTDGVQSTDSPHSQEEPS